jgi:hypothetical protein
LQRSRNDENPEELLKAKGEKHYVLRSANLLILYGMTTWATAEAMDGMYYCVYG